MASSTLPVYHSPYTDDLDPFNSSFTQDEDILSSIDLKTITPNVKVYNFSGIDVPQKYLDILGLGFPFIPSSSSFSLNSALDTLHNICHKLHKETIPPSDYNFKPSYSRVPILSFKDTKEYSTTPVFESFMDDEGCLSAFFNACYADLSSTFNSLSSKNSFRNLTHNIDPKLLKDFITFISSSKDLVIAGIDKNLGIVLVNDTMDRESAGAHLYVVKNYRMLTILEADVIVQGFYDFLLSWCREYFGNNFQSHPDAAFMLTITPELSKYSKFKNLYKGKSIFSKPLPKVCVTRPLCASVAFVTCGASRFIHCLLIPVLARIKNPTIITSSAEAFTKISSLVLPDSCFLAAFDVTALYPSIPIDDACESLNRLLVEIYSAPGTHSLFSLKDIKLIVELVRRVLSTNITNFRGQLFIQLVGGAMGTSCFPSIAIIFLHMLERSLVKTFMDSMLCRLFLRYLDDMFCVFESEENAVSFFNCYNALHNDINITWSDLHEGGVVFLNLCFSKGRRFSSSNLLDSVLYQKPNNAFLYLHYDSFHTEAARTSWVVNSLKDLVTFCSSEDDYIALKLKFGINLLSRAFPLSVVRHLFKKVGYDLREFFLRNPHVPVSKGQGMWFIPYVYSTSSEFLDLENLVRTHWSMFDYSKHKELTKFSRKPTFSYTNGESLRQIIDKVNSRRYKLRR